jgi:hypothetical protein
LAAELADAFARAFDRESNLPPQERLEAACAEMFDVGLSRCPAAAARLAEKRGPKVVDELAELRLQMDAGPMKAEVAAAFGIEPGLLIGPGVSREIRGAQQAFWLRLTTELRWSQRKIAQLCAVGPVVVFDGLKRERARVAASAQRKERASGT